MDLLALLDLDPNDQATQGFASMMTDDGGSAAAAAGLARVTLMGRYAAARAAVVAAGTRAAATRPYATVRTLVAVAGAAHSTPLAARVAAPAWWSY